MDYEGCFKRDIARLQGDDRRELGEGVLQAADKGLEDRPRCAVKKWPQSPRNVCINSALHQHEMSLVTPDDVKKPNGSLVVWLGVVVVVVVVVLAFVGGLRIGGGV